MPRAAESLFVDQHLHDEIDDEPRREDEDEPHADVPEYLLRAFRLAGLTSRRYVLPSCIGKQHRGEEHRDVDAGIERVLGKLGDVTNRAWICARRARARHDRRDLRERERDVVQVVERVLKALLAGRCGKP